MAAESGRGAGDQGCLAAEIEWLHTAFLAGVSSGGNMDLGLKGKRVLITGGTKSIGRAIVDAFVAEGATVGFCARDAKLVRQREEEWRGRQARVQGAVLDVTDDPALKQWIDGFAAEGGIDHFLANVSALGTDDTPEGWRKSIDTTSSRP